MAQRQYQNVWLDCHLDKPSAIMADMGYAPGASTLGVRHIMAAIHRHIREDQRSGLPVMVGKWSSALPIADAAMTPEGRVALERIYSSEQLTAYEKLPAWFFQTWKTTGRLSSWDARVALSSFERGLICS
jgi:glucan 1,3-beta-glucosidase